MSLVLMRRAWKDDPEYKDTEFVVYHYPHQYFDRIHGGEKFAYYRRRAGRTHSRRVLILDAASWAMFGKILTIRRIGTPVFESPFGSLERLVTLMSSHRMYELRFVALVARERGELVPVNELARQLPVFR